MRALARSLRRGLRLAGALTVAAAGGLPAGRALAAQEPAGAPRVALGDPGPGAAGRLLRSLLARPHALLVPAGPRVVLPRDTTFEQSVVIVGADLYLESVVQGDVVVVGGDLFLRPGAAVLGRAVAFGGGVYHSLLARVDGRSLAFRDVTFDATADDAAGDAALVLDYRSLRPAREAVFALPGIYGLRVPAYTRADGLAVAIGPTVSLLGGDVEIDPTVTYRSHLGVLDPAIRITVEGEAPLQLTLAAGRGTFTNDAWMRSDLVNSAATLVFGDDVRNYYRASRAELRIQRRWEAAEGVLAPGIGVLTEDATAVGPTPGSDSAPWSLFGRDDADAILRPNPPVTGGRITSLLALADGEWESPELWAAAAVRTELSLDAPGDRRFVQTTVHAEAAFPVLARHRFEARGHAVATVGDTAPSQRFAYLGGGSTLATTDQLAFGGDQLLFLEGIYLVPLSRPVLPLLGPPTVGLRYAVGGAGVDRLPSLVQNLGLRLQLNLLRFDLMLDPARGNVAIGIGASTVP